MKQPNLKTSIPSTVSEGTTNVDPCLWLLAAFQMLMSFASAEARTEAAALRLSVAVGILETIDGVLKFDFWEELIFGPELFLHGVPDASSRRKRSEAIRAHITLLQGDSAGNDELTAALDFACDLVDQLNAEFSLGKMPAERPAPDHVRYYCAAMIQVLAQQFEEVWMPFRQEAMVRTRKVRGRRKACRG